MPYSPNLNATYARYPNAWGPVALLSTAKTVFTDITNSVVLVSKMADFKQVLSTVYAEVVITPSANGKISLFLYNDATAWQIASKPFTTAAAVSTTAQPTQIAFDYSVAAPLIVNEGLSLYVGLTVAQTAGTFNMFGWGKVY